MKKSVIILIFFAWTINNAVAQETDTIFVIDNINDITLLQEPDSIVVSFYLIKDKETSSYLDDDSVGAIRFFKSAVLLSKECVRLSKYLFFEKSYQDQYAVLNHNDINIKYYKNGIIYNDIYISSITRNITINSIGNNSQQIIFKKQITKRFEKHLSNLLRKKKIWNNTNGFDNNL
jgi:hypothetical protein